MTEWNPYNKYTTNLDKRVPVRGRKFTIKFIYYMNVFDLDKRVPVRGRKLFKAFFYKS